MPPIKGVYRGARGVGAERLGADDPQRRVTLSHLMGDHLIVMHSAVRALPGYNRHDAPVILMDGPSITQRDRARPRRDRAADAPARHAQRGAARRRSTRSAPPHIPKGIRRQAREACEDYFYNRLGLAPEQALDLHAPLPPSLEQLPDPIYKALEDLVELVVDGKYEDLSELSGEAELDPDELRRRVEDDCPEAFVLPPREHYVVEAIAEVRRPRRRRLGATSSTSGPRTARRSCTSRASCTRRDDRFNVTLSDILP